jgi:hypothetical protein
LVSFSEREWIAELVAANVLVPAGVDDRNGNPAYELRKFPRGKRGRKLKALFDRHVVQERVDGQR